MSREVMEFDVVIVGAGPAGLSAAIRLAQLGQQHNKMVNIAVIEKAGEVGAQILSGAVLEPRALNELIPDWRDKQAPVITAATEDKFLFLTSKKAFRLPTPKQMHNQGNYIISLGKLCRWLGEQAESLGVNIFPSFAATEVLYEQDKVKGIVLGEKGVDKQGNPTSRYQPAMELHAKQVFFAEGCRGSLTQTLFDRFQLRKDADPQTYGLGLKEIWEIPPEVYKAGSITHSIGWPLDQKTYGGSFLYHFEEKYLAIGFVVGLDYSNPYFNPYEEFQKFKAHPAIAPLLKTGKRIAYGARTLNEGGLQSIPKLTFPGGLIIGCGAGFLNVPKIKGIHNAMKSGMVAAESVFSMLETSQAECTEYSTHLRQSWVWEDLYLARNIRPAMNWGLIPGLACAALDTYVFRGRAPWTLHHYKADNACLKKADQCKKLTYPKHDNQVSFDLLSSVYLTNTHHEENQPCHLKLKVPMVAIDINWKEYASPEQRYCPAGVYEIVKDNDNFPHLQINAANCIQCKACDIKDPTQNIVWTPPEGGSGPQYSAM